jgi:hypothetical protein
MSMSKGLARCRLREWAPHHRRHAMGARSTRGDQLPDRDRFGLVTRAPLPAPVPLVIVQVIPLVAETQRTPPSSVLCPYWRIGTLPPPRAPQYPSAGVWLHTRTTPPG